METLVRTYGRGLTALFIGLVGFWILLMIIVPQIRMIERAFTYEDRAGETATLALAIDRAYTEKFQLEQELSGLERAGPAVGQMPSAPSPFAPSMTMPSATPVAPAIPSLPTPGMVPSASAPSALSDEDRTARAEELRDQIATLDKEIAELEAKEDTSSGEAGMKERISLENFTSMSGLHLKIFAMTLLYALTVTICTFLISYPVAYAAAMAETRGKLTLILIGLVIPYASNELLRIFSWVMILEKNGVLNSLLDSLGLIDLAAGEGFRFVASNGAVFSVMVYAYMLFMVFPMYNTIDTLDKAQIEAARDLGGSIWKIHTRIVIPHAKPGIAVGSIITFMLSAGTIAAPEIVGRGLHPDWFSQLIYRRFFEADSWNQGSAYSLALLAACILFILINMAIFKVSVRDIAK
ncbi:ABC transporter permease [Roseibium aestuarii]|uniref:ABC transporter permease subunit n=1 Tax=Roseibium aestuarii TaxID=2600299 RepID=A0ABW4JZY1_9HYPH|nr:ABC transporter permease [Roseibium aestuarii]